MHSQHQLEALRTAIPYIRAFKGRIFVIKLGGALCEPGRTLDHLVEQLALLYQLGVKLIVVHGGGEQANALGERLGVKPKLFAGRRITDADTLEVVQMAFAGTVNTNLLAAFRKAHVPGVGLSGLDGELLAVTKRPVQSASDPRTGESRDVDFGFVGDIDDVNTRVLHQQLDGGFVPVVCSLAADSAGQIYNVNADTVAARIAVAIEAAKYFLVSNVDGVMRDVRDPSTLQSYLDLAELRELIDCGAIGDGMLPKLAACISALEGGVPRVHIINGTAQDTLLGEVFTNEGCGTLLVKSREANNEVAPSAADP